MTPGAHSLNDTDIEVTWKSCIYAPTCPAYISSSPMAHIIDLGLRHVHNPLYGWV